MAKRSWFSVRNSGGGNGSVSILDEIGAFGVTFADFRNSVNALGRVRTLNISINSPGGDVYTGFAIYDYLNRLSARKVITVEGLAASMASVIFMAGDERIMPQNATLMIHNPMGSIAGGGEEIVQFGESVKKLRTQIANAYVDATLQPKGEILKMMDAQSWLDAATAFDLGFATQVEEPAKIAAFFDVSKFGNAPKTYGFNKRGLNMTKKTGAQADTEFEDTAADREAIRKEERDALLARHKEITALCTLARKPDLAAKFIEDDKSPAEVTAELAKLVAEEGKGKGKGKGTEVSARHDAREETPTVPEIDTAKIYARFNKTKAVGL
jgi:ATP-dependent Clp protease protease subunit